MTDIKFRKEEADLTDISRIEGQKDDATDDARRQFMERFGELAIAAAPAVALLVTSINSPAMAQTARPS
jgi:hypothetical protein